MLQTRSICTKIAHTEHDVDVSLGFTIAHSLREMSVRITEEGKRKKESCSVEKVV